MSKKNRLTIAARQSVPLRIACLMLGSSLLFFLPWNLQAAPADLDTSFSTDGYAGVGRVFLHPDGRLLTLEDFASGPVLHAYDDAGNELDSQSANVAPGETHRSMASAIQSNGKILVAGYSYVVNNSLGDTAFVARFNPDLTLDSTFATNGSRRFNTSLNTSTRIYGIGVEADDKILLATRCNCSPGNSILVRLEAEGDFDNSFGVNGEAIYPPFVAGDPILNFDMNSRTVAIAGDGTIYAAGNGSNSANQSGMGVVAYDKDGDVVTGFGESGVAIALWTTGSDEANAIALQKDGKILLAGKVVDGGPGDLAVVRLLTDGSLDSGFNAAGAVPGIFSHNTGGAVDTAFDLVVQPDNKIVFGGQGDPNVLASLEGVIGRLESNGVLDTGFATTGVLVDATICCNGVYGPTAIQPDGNILAWTTSSAPAQIARFEGNAVDLEPDAFSFVDTTGVTTSSQQVSNLITVAGIDAGVEVPVHVDGGEYRVNGGSYTSQVSYVGLGDQLQLRHSASASANTAVNTTLTIGGLTAASNPSLLLGSTVMDVFTSTTATGGGADTTPDSFVFVDQTDVALNTPITSNLITVSGIDAASPISVTGGEYSINAMASTSAPGTVILGDSISLRLVSSANEGITTTATLTIGGVADSFSVTTLTSGGGGGGGGGGNAIGLLLLPMLGLLGLAWRRRQS